MRDVSSRKIKDQCCFQMVEMARLKMIIVVGFFRSVMELQRYRNPSTMFWACSSLRGMVDFPLDHMLISTQTYFQNRYLIGHRKSIWSASSVGCWHIMHAHERHLAGEIRCMCSRHDMRLRDHLHQ